MIAYQTAWLKNYYPIEFLTANISSNINDTDNVVKLINDGKRMGITINPPDINLSDADFTILDDTTMQYGLAAIKNVGYKASMRIADYRKTNGSYQNIFDLATSDTQQINKKIIESLILVGACQCLGKNRAELFNSIEKIISFSAKFYKNQNRNQESLFNSTNDSDVHYPILEPCESWPTEKELKYEKELLGFYLSGNPLEKYENDLIELSTIDSNGCNLFNSEQVGTGGFISNITLVKIFSKEKYELQRIRNVSKQRLHTNITLYGYKTQMNLINNILQGVMLAVVLFYSLFLWQNGIITLGDVIMFFGITASIQGAMIGIAESIDLFFDQYGQLEEGLETLLKPHDIVDKKGAQNTPLLHGDIQFNAVSFKYNGVYVFKNLNLHIPQNQKVGIVGHSGAGKTTLLKILLRLYDIQKGEILIDKKNIQDITQNSLRQHMSTVTQEPEMFNRSIYENISYGFNTTKKAVLAAAKIAHAHEFIQQLPKKYDTVVGERGVTLSGGQKQRIAIARAVIKNAPILVLDEATSALDSESETLIQDAFQTLMKDKTVIAVAHRLSTLLAMDRIIVLEKGKIIEDGNHKTLLKKKGVYAAMWKKQSGGYLKE